MSDERLPSLAFLHMHKHNDIDIDKVIKKFASTGRRLTLSLRTTLARHMLRFWFHHDIIYWRYTENN